MSYLDTLIDDVNSSHKDLGELIAVCQIAVKARKFVLLVSPSGCGKSRAMDYIGKNTPDSWMPTSISIASLGNKVDKLNSFRSVIGIDDIATIQTPYSRQTTITTLSQLCYTHRVEPSMVGFDFAVEDFYGSALVGIQPIILRDLMLAPEWDASIQDKALRYYHLYRPTIVNGKSPVFKLKWGISFDSVKDFEPDKENKDYKLLVEYGMSQWSIARTKEHLIDLLKGIAALESRKEVIESDYKLLAKLLKPMTIENIAVTKEDLEGERILDNNLIALLVEYFTYGGEFSLAHIARDFKGITIKQAYKIMGKQNGNWQKISKSPTIYKPSKELERILKEFKLNIKELKK